MTPFDCYTFEMVTFAVSPFSSVRMIFLLCMLAHNFAPLAVFNSAGVSLAVAVAARFLTGQRFVLSRTKVIPNARTTQFDKREILAQNHRQIAGGAAWPP